MHLNKFLKGLTYLNRHLQVVYSVYYVVFECLNFPGRLVLTRGKPKKIPLTPVASVNTWPPRHHMYGNRLMIKHAWSPINFILTYRRRVAAYTSIVTESVHISVKNMFCCFSAKVLLFMGYLTSLAWKVHSVRWISRLYSSLELTIIGFVEIYYLL